MLPRSEDPTEHARVTRLSTEQLYREHRPFVARFLTRLGVRPEVLDDAVQEVFVTVHQRGGYVLGPAKPITYLATIATYTAATQRRLSRTQHARQSEHAPEELPTACPDPLLMLETRQELQRLGRALQRLDPALRSTLLLADGEGHSCVAIADATSVPLGTVYWRLDRARKKIREALRIVDGCRGPCAQTQSGELRLSVWVTLLGWRRPRGSLQTRRAGSPASLLPAATRSSP